MDGNVTVPKWVDDWVAPLEIRTWFPYYLAGHDENGSPLYVLEYGNWKFIEALANGKGDAAKVKQDFWKYFQQGVYRMFRDGKANDTQGVGVIFDWNGFSLANYADPIAIELALRQFAALNSIYKVLNYAILINSKSLVTHSANNEPTGFSVKYETSVVHLLLAANFAAENFLRIAKPFIGNILEKCEIFGAQKAKWLPHILKKVSPSQLPHWYGGDEDWKPMLMGGMQIHSAVLTSV